MEGEGEVLDGAVLLVVLPPVPRMLAREVLLPAGANKTAEERDVDALMEEEVREDREDAGRKKKEVEVVKRKKDIWNVKII